MHLASLTTGSQPRESRKLVYVTEAKPHRRLQQNAAGMQLIAVSGVANPGPAIGAIAVAARVHKEKSLLAVKWQAFSCTRGLV
jgi:hypothetical protein